MTAMDSAVPIRTRRIRPSRPSKRSRKAVKSGLEVMAVLRNSFGFVWCLGIAVLGFRRQWIGEPAIDTRGIAVWWITFGSPDDVAVQSAFQFARCAPHESVFPARFVGCRDGLDEQ